MPGTLSTRTATLVAALALGLVAGCSDDDDDDAPLGDDAARPLLGDPFAPVGGTNTGGPDPSRPPVASGAPVGGGADGLADGQVDGQTGGPVDAPADDDPIAGRPFAPVPVPGDTRDLAGLYDASIGRPLGTDIRYVLITPDGVLVEYDYDLDPYGTGLNCHRAGAPRTLVRERGDDYLLDGRSVRIARETLGIGFGYTDTLDDDRDGDFTDFVYYRYPRLAGVSATDLNLCR